MVNVLHTNVNVKEAGVTLTVLPLCVQMIALEGETVSMVFVIVTQTIQEPIARNSLAPTIVLEMGNVWTRHAVVMLILVESIAQ